MSLDKTSRLIREAIWPNFLKFLRPPPSPSIARTWCVVDQTRWSVRREGGGENEMKSAVRQTNKHSYAYNPLPLSLFLSLLLSFFIFLLLPSFLPPSLSLSLSPSLSHLLSFTRSSLLPKYLSRNWVGGSGGGDGSGRAF